MTDRLSPPRLPAPAPTPRREGAIRLASRGKTWAHLLEDGRYLEVRRHGIAVTFDLWASARLGRAVVVGWEEGGEE